MSNLSNKELEIECFSALQKNIWGYGIKRIYIGTTDAITYPNNFSGFGYKDKKGDLLLGVRWNKFPHLHAKFRMYQPGDDIMEKWADIVTEFKRENTTA